MLKEFFKIFNVEIKPDFDTLIGNCEKILNEKRIYTANLRINGREILISSNKTLKIPSKSEVEFLSFSGSGGTNAIPVGVNLNWRRFTVRQNITLKVKDDFKEVFKIRLVMV